MLDQLFQIIKLLRAQRFHVGKIDRIINLTVGANVLIDELCLALQNSHAAPMEPVLAFITANVKSVTLHDNVGYFFENPIRGGYLLGFIVRLFAQAVQFLRLASMLAFATHKLVDFLGLLLGDSNAVPVEPIMAQVTTDVKSAEGKGEYCNSKNSRGFLWILLGIVIGRSTEA